RPPVQGTTNSTPSKRRISLHSARPPNKSEWSQNSPGAPVPSGFTYRSDPQPRFRPPGLHLLVAPAVVARTGRSARLRHVLRPAGVARPPVASLPVADLARIMPGHDIFICKAHLFGGRRSEPDGPGRRQASGSERETVA